MSALGEYRKARGKPLRLSTIFVEADAAIAELEAELAAEHIDGLHWMETARRFEVERDALRCCGNCGHYLSTYQGVDCAELDNEGAMDFVNAPDHCHFAPSRWTARE